MQASCLFDPYAMNTAISVVICCYNSANRLPKVLDHLARQKFLTPVVWEVLVVDNASKDNTGQIAYDCWDQQIAPLRVVLELTPGLSYAREAGLKQALYPIVSFVDDDNWVEEYWVQKIADHFQNHPQTTMLGGKGEAAFEEEKPLWFDTIQRAFAVGPQGAVSGPTQKPLYGAGFTIRREAWEALFQKGFHFIFSGRKGTALTSGEDSELCYALILAGYELFYKEDLHFFHFMPASRMQWAYVKKLYQAFGRTAPVLSLYRSFIPGPKLSYLGQLKIYNPLVRLIHLMYDHFFSLLDYWRIRVRSSKQNPVELNYWYTKYAVLEMLRLFFSYSSIAKSIKTASWRQSHNKS